MNSDFSTIIFESDTLGSTYWSNSTNAKFVKKLKKKEKHLGHAYLEFDSLKNILTAKVIKKDIEKIEGDNDIMIELIDEKEMNKEYKVRLMMNFIRPPVEIVFE